MIIYYPSIPDVSLSFKPEEQLVTMSFALEPDSIRLPSG
jgi:hypothetical protein